MKNPETTSLQFSGVAFTCSADGTVTRTMRDDRSAAERLSPGDAAVSLVDEGSIGKFLSFLARVGQDSVATGWELNVRVGERVVPMYFVGARVKDEYVVVASISDEEADAFLEQFMQMHNEQTNSMREIMKERSVTQRVYDQLSAVNNEMAALQRDLQKKNRELSQVIGMAAHDLRNPLGSFRALADMLPEMVSNPTEEFRTVVAEMRRSAQHMLTLVNDLLDVSRIEAGRLELHRAPTEIIRLVTDSISLLRIAAARKSISLEISAPADDVVLDIDGGKIEQVVNNLVSNAIKFSDQGTRVVVSVVFHPGDGERDGFVKISVSDEGQGIPETELSKLFKPFGRTSVQATAGEESTGLGLVICRRIILGHGGTIDVESVVGSGSVFSFTLPMRPING